MTGLFGPRRFRYVFVGCQEVNGGQIYKDLEWRPPATSWRGCVKEDRLLEDQVGGRLLP